MSKAELRQLIADRLPQDGLIDTHLAGVKLFKASTPIPCAPAVYEPCVIAIVNGAKEAVLDGQRHIYDTGKYLCCAMSTPLQAGTPNASPEAPLMGVLVTLDQKLMTELTLEMDGTAAYQQPAPKVGSNHGIRLANWDTWFSDALLRLLSLDQDPTDAAILGKARLRELYYAILKGEAGAFARQAFGAGNAIARAIAHVSAHLDAPVSIDDLAARAGMSRAAFHRKFKAATSLSPIQFVKTMRLNAAAMNMANGMSVNRAARDVGYVSQSQFSRDFKRMYGQSPRDWSDSHKPVMHMT